MLDCRSVNLVILVGRVGGDPQISNPGKSKLAIFSLATERGFYKTGLSGGKEWESRVSWHSIKAWDADARACEKLKKGDLISVEGWLSYDEWGEGDSKKEKTFVVADKIVQLQRNLKNESPE